MPLAAAIDGEDQQDLAPGRQRERLGEITARPHEEHDDQHDVDDAADDAVEPDRGDRRGRLRPRSFEGSERWPPCHRRWRATPG